MIITTAQMKEQLNVTFDDDDDLIDRKIEAAQNHIERLLGFGIEATYGGDGQDPIPPALVEAVSQLAAWFYEQREAVNVGNIVSEVPFSVNEIVREYRAFTYG